MRRTSRPTISIFGDGTSWHPSPRAADPSPRPRSSTSSKPSQEDPNYAIAYAGIADAFIAIERNMGAAATPLDRRLTRAKAAAERAVELDPMLSEAQSAMASIRAREYAWQDAERGFRRAIELNPNNALAHLELGASVLVVQERFEEGLGRSPSRGWRWIRFRPTSTRNSARALLLAGRYEEAVDQFRKAITGPEPEQTVQPDGTRPLPAGENRRGADGVRRRASSEEHLLSGRGLAGLCRSACRTTRKGARSPSRATAVSPLSAALGARPTRASAMRSTRSTSREDRLQKRTGSSRDPSGAGAGMDAPNARFAALRKKVNLAP